MAVITRCDEEIEKLQDAGVDLVFIVYAEAGIGFSDHVCSLYDKSMDMTVVVATD